MKCRQARLNLPGLLDHSLDSATADKLQKHLAQCKDCAEEFRFLKAYRDKVAVLPQERASADFYAKVTERIDTASTLGFWNRYLKGRTRFIPQLAGLTAVLLVLLVSLRIHEATMNQIRQPIPEKTFNQNITADQSARMESPKSAFQEKNGAMQTPAQDKNSAGGGLNKKIAVQTPKVEVTPSEPVNYQSLNKEDDNNIRTPESHSLAEAAEQTPGSETRRSKSAAAPLPAFNVGMRIVKLVIEPENGHEQTMSDAAPLLNKQEVATKSASPVKNVKAEKTPSPNDTPNAPFSLDELLDKYHIRIITREEDPQKQVLTRVLEIPDPVYQDFLTDLAKLGILQTQIPTDGVPGGETIVHLRVIRDK